MMSPLAKQFCYLMVLGPVAIYFGWLLLHARECFNRSRSNRNKAIDNSITRHENLQSSGGRLDGYTSYFDPQTCRERGKVAQWN